MNETGLVLYVYHQGEDDQGEETCLTVSRIRRVIARQLMTSEQYFINSFST